MIREYELGLVINPDLNEEQLEAQLLRIGQTVETNGGAVTKLDRWGRRRMSYPIARHRDGYYAFMDLQLDSSAVREVESVLHVQEEVLRHIIVWRDPRAQAERRRREQEDAMRAARMEAARAAEAARAEAAPPPVVEAAPPPALESEALAPVAETPAPVAEHEAATAESEAPAPAEPPAEAEAEAPTSDATAEE